MMLQPKDIFRQWGQQIRYLQMSDHEKLLLVGWLVAPSWWHWGYIFRMTQEGEYDWEAFQAPCWTWKETMEKQ